jgi:hypothetical protein
MCTNERLQRIEQVFENALAQSRFNQLALLG